MMDDCLTLEDGTLFRPNENTTVQCEHHGVIVKWGDLTPIQQLAFAEGIDTIDECILLPSLSERA
jgi:hypothetical protein